MSIAKAGPLKGIAQNLQANESKELKNANYELWRKLKPTTTAKRWYTNQGEWPKKCTVTNCPTGKDARDGAHVFIEGQGENHVFILPTCHSCNVNVIEIPYEGVPYLLCVLTTREREELDAAHEESVSKKKSRSKHSTWEKFKAAVKKKVTRKKAAPPPTQEEEYDVEDTSTYVRVKEICGSTNTKTGDPCRNGPGCSIKNHRKSNK